MLGCREVITYNKLRQVGITTPEPALDADQKDALDLLLLPLPLVRQTRSRVPRPHAAESAKTDESAQERAESDSEEEGFRDVIKKLSGKDDALSRAIEGMQTAQAQQNQPMTQLPRSFNRYMDAKTSKKSKDRDTELF